MYFIYLCFLHHLSVKSYDSLTEQEIARNPTIYLVLTAMFHAQSVDPVLTHWSFIWLFLQSGGIISILQIMKTRLKK